jgi:hypothetical protein
VEKLEGMAQVDLSIKTSEEYSVSVMLMRSKEETNNLIFKQNLN